MDESGQAGDAAPARRDGPASGWPAADQASVEQRPRYADLLAPDPAPESAPPYPYEGDLDDQQRSYGVPPGFRAREESAPVVPGARAPVVPVPGSASERDADREAPDWPAWTPRSPERHWSSTWSPAWSRTDQPGTPPSSDPPRADDLPASFPVRQPHRRGLSRRFGADWDDGDPPVRPAGEGATEAAPPPGPLPEQHPTWATSAWAAAPEPPRPLGSANGAGSTGEQPALPPGFASAPSARAVPRHHDAADGPRAEPPDPPGESGYPRADRFGDVDRDPTVGQGGFPAASSALRTPAGFGHAEQASFRAAAAPVSPGTGLGVDRAADAPRAAAPVSPARVAPAPTSSDQPTGPGPECLDGHEAPGPAGYPRAAGTPAGHPQAAGTPAGYPQAAGTPGGYPQAAGTPGGYPRAAGTPAGHAQADPDEVARRAGYPHADHGEAAERAGEPPASAGQPTEAGPDRPFPGPTGQGTYWPSPTPQAGYPPASSGPLTDVALGQPDPRRAAAEGGYEGYPTARAGFAPAPSGPATEADLAGPDRGHVAGQAPVPAAPDRRTEVGIGRPDRGHPPEQAGGAQADRGHVAGQPGVAASSPQPPADGSRPDRGRAPEQTGDARADGDEMAGPAGPPQASSEQSTGPGFGRLDRGAAREGHGRVEGDAAMDPTDDAARRREHTAAASPAAPEPGLSASAPEQPRDGDGAPVRSPRAGPAVAPEFTSLESIGRGLGPRPRPEDTLVQPDANGRRGGFDPVEGTSWPASSQWPSTPPSSAGAAELPDERRHTAAHPEVVTGRASVRPPTDEQLPQRVPAEPDVPTVPEPPSDAPADPPQLARIATHLRRDDVPPQHRDRPEGFDVRAILAAVRGVAGVRDASLRTTPAGAHSLRLDLSDGADPAEVSRHVARLLQETMGLAAAPQNLPGLPPDPSPQPPGLTPSELEATAREETQLVQQALDGPRRRRGPPHRGRAQVAQRRVQPTEPVAPPPPHEPGVDAFPQLGAAAGIVGAVSGIPVTAAAPYAGGHYAPAAEPTPSRPLMPGAVPGPRVVIDHVQVSTFGLDATVEVRLAAGAQRAVGMATGPAVDGYVLRLCAVSAASAIDELLRRSERVGDRGRCFVEHAAVVPFGGCEVAVVVILLVCAGWVEQLAGSALVGGDPRQAVVRATLGAVNRRLEALIS